MADNSDDEKRLEKAEKATERKAAKKKKACSRRAKAPKDRSAVHLDSSQHQRRMWRSLP